jgi:hypothetical protein
MIQLRGLGLIEKRVAAPDDSSYTVWRLTAFGEEYMITLMAAHRPNEGG